MGGGADVGPWKPMVFRSLKLAHPEGDTLCKRYRLHKNKCNHVFND